MAVIRWELGHPSKDLNIIVCCFVGFLDLHVCCVFSTRLLVEAVEPVLRQTRLARSLNLTPEARKRKRS